MNKKGFTLIELLSIITVLAFISLIAVPSIVNVISNNKEKLYDVQINNIKNAMKAYVSSNTFSFPNSGSVYLTLYQLASHNLIDYKVENPITGNNISLDTVLEIKNTGSGLEYIVNINDSDTVYEDSLLEYMPQLELTKDYGDTYLDSNAINIAKINGQPAKSNVDITKINDTLYKYSLRTSQVQVSAYYNVTFYIGKEVYFNPVTGQSCNEYIAGSSINGVKYGCMKWYVYNIDGDNVDMILDHNTTPVVKYNSEGNISSEEIDDALKSDISTWVNFVKDKTRLITASEIAKVTQASNTLTWLDTKPFSLEPVNSESISWYYLNGSLSSDPLWQTKVAGDNKFAFLYNNTACILEEENYGCEVSDNNLYSLSSDTTSNILGYWTSTPVITEDGSYIWAIKRDGSINSSLVTDDGLGIRPVITVSKNLAL